MYLNAIQKGGLIYSHVYNAAVSDTKNGVKVSIVKARNTVPRELHNNLTMYLTTDKHHDSAVH